MFTRVASTLRCRGRPEAVAREAHRRRRLGAVRWRPSAVRSGTLPPAAARRRDRSRVAAVIRTVPRLRGRRRKVEELGDDGFGGAQHGGDQRRQVEVALTGGAHDAGQDLLGVGAVAGAG